jgi:branched-chain amino acid transport system substrate-binding protein
VYLRDASKVGFTPLTIGAPPMSDVELMAKQAGVPNAADRLVALSPLGYSPADPKMAPWRDRLAKEYPGDAFTISHMLGIASGQFVVEALRRAGPDLTRAKLVQVMSELTVPVDTLGGPLSCTPTDHQCHRTPTLFGLKDGKAATFGSVTVPRRP